MDIFRFNNTNHPMKMEQGQIINNLKSKLWIERYQKEGEFKLIADIGTGVLEKLPRGTFISHLETDEIMVVEDHEINANKKKAEVIISGRSFLSILNDKMVGTFFGLLFYGDGYNPTGYLNVPALTKPADQLEYLIERTILSSYVGTDNNIPWVNVTQENTTGSAGPERTIVGGNLYDAVLEFMTEHGLAIRSVRPGRGVAVTGGTTYFVVYQGLDRKSEVIFSHTAGEIEDAQYFWSSRPNKTGVVVAGKFIRVLVHPGPELGHERKLTMVRVDGIDDAGSTIPSGAALIAAENELIAVGNSILAAQNPVAITRVEVTKEGTRWQYRQDYNMGDLVTVMGDFEAVATKRVIEHVEVEDETGRKTYPTLADL